MTQQAGLIESVQAEMPEDAKHGSDVDTRDVYGPRLKSAASGAGYKKKVLETLHRPLVIAMTKDEKRPIKGSTTGSRWRAWASYCRAASVREHGSGRCCRGVVETLSLSCNTQFSDLVRGGPWKR